MWVCKNRRWYGSISIARALVAVLLLLGIVQAADATTIYVNQAGWWFEGEDFHASDTPISDAVEAASDGDTIIVKDGRYEENVDIDKSVTIRSENGSANCIVEADKSSDDVFEVSANGLSIIGFSITGAKGTNKAGVRLGFVDDCTVRDCVIWNCNFGVYVRGTSGNTAQNTGSSTLFRSVIRGSSSLERDVNTVKL